MTAIRFEGVSKQFGGYTAIQNVDLDVSAGAFVSVVGPSGCGKSTLLNLAAGLTEPSAGLVSIFGDPLNGLNRRAGYMFQQDALLPWKTVSANVSLGLRFRNAPDAESQARDWIARVGLQNFADAYPSQLSGGMRKRVAMAQSWIVNPDILLMDEPFSALDVHTRLRMESELLTLWTASPKTVLFVTHDLEEALALADEVVVLSAGPASRVVNRYAVDLPRPRDLIDIRTEPRFAELYRQIWADLREEVLASYERES
ncbi:MAG TPA: ABC transporter ATP-binding protein [Bryobacteraceae bacterium]|nr:ABC transporter ATP-binding protein [Bryobacteraceae bacterium]